jgi:hypothetical protein
MPPTFGKVARGVMVPAGVLVNVAVGREVGVFNAACCVS